MKNQKDMKKNQDFEKNQEEKKWGGKREGAGRPEGSISEERKTLLEYQKAMQERIAANSPRLIDALLTLALGSNYLFCVSYEGEGKNRKKVVERVTDLPTIQAYLNGELEESDSSSEGYYYVTAEKPNAFAISDLLNRGFGKPKETVDIKTKEPLTKVVIEIIDSNNGTTDESNERLSEDGSSSETIQDNM